MVTLECPNCGGNLANGAAVCGTCGKEVHDDENASAPHAKSLSRKNVYWICVVFLAMVGGVVLLILTGILPSPIKSSSTVAIVNGQEISMEDVDQKFEIYEKMSGKRVQEASSTPESKAAAADVRMQILQTIIQERILVTEAVKEKIGVTPREITYRISDIKKSLNFSDQDFDGFLQKHDMTIANFERRIAKNLLIEKLMDKGTKEKGLTKDAWLAELNKRAKVEILTK